MVREAPFDAFLGGWHVVEQIGYIMIEDRH